MGLADGLHRDSRTTGSAKFQSILVLSGIYYAFAPIIKKIHYLHELLELVQTSYFLDKLAAPMVKPITLSRAI